MAKDCLDAAKEIYSKLKNWGFARETITDYFQNNPGNKDKKAVLTKIVLIDSLYFTNLAKVIPLTTLAERICNSELEKELDNGGIEAIETIIGMADKKIISFASKYCHFHKKEKYPIYDKFVCKALHKIVGYKNQVNYPLFVKAVKEAQKKIGCAESDFERMDTFLWLYGMKLTLDKKQKIKINAEVKGIYKKELFEKLEPWQVA